MLESAHSSFSPQRTNRFSTSFNSWRDSSGSRRGGPARNNSSNVFRGIRHFTTGWGIGDLWGRM